MMNKEHCCLHIYTKKKYFNFDSNSKSFHDILTYLLISRCFLRPYYFTVILSAKKRMITSKYVMANAIYVGVLFCINTVLDIPISSIPHEPNQTELSQIQI